MTVDYGWPNSGMYGTLVKFEQEVREMDEASLLHMLNYGLNSWKSAYGRKCLAILRHEWACRIGDCEIPL